MYLCESWPKCSDLTNTFKASRVFTGDWPHVTTASLQRETIQISQSVSHLLEKSDVIIGCAAAWMWKISWPWEGIIEFVYLWLLAFKNVTIMWRRSKKKMWRSMQRLACSKILVASFTAGEFYRFPAKNTFLKSTTNFVPPINSVLFRDRCVKLVVR